MFHLVFEQDLQQKKNMSGRLYENLHLVDLSGGNNNNNPEDGDYYGGKTSLFEEEEEEASYTDDVAYVVRVDSIPVSQPWRRDEISIQFLTTQTLYLYAVSSHHEWVAVFLRDQSADKQKYNIFLDGSFFISKMSYSLQK